MSFNQFAPQSTTQLNESVTMPAVSANDPINRFLLRAMRMSLISFGMLLPLFFLPGLWGTLDFQKNVLAIVALVVVAICGSLLALRTRTVVSAVPLPIMMYGLLTVVAIVSAVFSNDMSAALRGSTLETQSVAFICISFVLMVATLVFQQSKRYAFYLCAALGAGLLTLITYIALRLFAGPILSFSSFGLITQSPVGNFNDTALAAGLVVILSVIAMLQLQLRRVTQLVLSGFVGLALLLLAVVNFFYVWLLIGFFGLMILLYLLSYDSLFAAPDQSVQSNQPKGLLIILTAIICVCSATFVVTGDYVGERVADAFGVDYLEVRPSFSATADIARGVYSENLLLGVGPNQFGYAWREHKDVAINQTLFWDTIFLSGSGYVPTLFITLGLLGGLAMVMFHAAYMFVGLRALLRPSSADSFWYFVGLYSFAGAVFLWGVSYVYVPGATILLLAASLTGLSFVAFSDLQPATKKSVALVTNQKRGFVVMAAAIFIITTSLYVVFTIGEQYVAQSSFNKAQATADSVAAIDQAAMRSYNLYPDDRFLGIRARVALLEMNQLMAVSEPTEVDQQRFLEVSDQALRFVSAAIAQAPQNPEYRAIQSSVYSNYALAGMPGALGRATSSLAATIELDPKNPRYALMEAQLFAAQGDAAGARAALQRSLAQKGNYTEALFALAQLDIAEGDVQSAIDSTRTIITFEPQNPARYYQLGILYTAAEQTQNALQAYSAALALDPNYANARYLRALLLLDQNETQAALADLRVVAQTNGENQTLSNLIGSIESGEFTATVGSPDLVNDVTPENSDGEVTSSVRPETDLVTPLNSVPDRETSDTTEVQFETLPKADESEVTDEQ